MYIYLWTAVDDAQQQRGGRGGGRGGGVQRGQRGRGGERRGCDDAVRPLGSDGVRARGRQGEEEQETTPKGRGRGGDDDDDDDDDDDARQLPSSTWTFSGMMSLTPGETAAAEDPPPRPLAR